MTPAETAKLLAMVQTFDRRNVGESEITGWHAVLADLVFEDCRDAVVEYFRSSRDWLMPADVVDGVRRLQLRRIEAAGPALYAGTDDLEGEEFIARLRANRARVLAGETPPELDA